MHILLFYLTCYPCLLRLCFKLVAFMNAACPLVQDDNVWSKDQITQDGVEPSTNDSLMGNSNLPANVRDVVKYFIKKCSLPPYLCPAGGKL